jgi:branched-chain amino acid transport system substrate-binding protein
MRRNVYWHERPNLVGGFGDALSGMTLVITELTEKADLPWLTQTFADVLTERGFKNILRLCRLPAQGQLTLPTVVDLAKSVVGSGPKSAAVIADTDIKAIQGMVKTWREGGFEKHGMTLLMEKSYTPPIADPTELVAGLRRNEPNVLFLMPSAIPDLKVLLDKLAEFGLGRDVLPTFAVAGPSGQPETLQMHRSGVRKTSLALTPIGGEKNIKSWQRNSKRVGSSMDDIAVFGWLWTDHDFGDLERAGAADRKKVADAIRKMDTATGPAEYFSGPLKWDEKGQRVGAGLVIAQWRDDQPVTVYPPALASTKPVWPGK